MPEIGWPEHTIELGRVLLKPPSGPRVGTACLKADGCIVPGLLVKRGHWSSCRNTVYVGAFHPTECCLQDISGEYG